jgi:hypothetical protein
MVRLLERVILTGSLHIETILEIGRHAFNAESTKS